LGSHKLHYQTAEISKSAALSQNHGEADLLNSTRNINKVIAELVANNDPTLVQLCEQFKTAATGNAS